MFILECPHCGPRHQSEYAYAGEAHIMRPNDGEVLTDEEWAKFVFTRRNTKGIFAERWVHVAGCRKYFNVLRNTATDEILAVYNIGEAAPEVQTDLPNTPSGETIGSGNDAVKIMQAKEITSEGQS